MSPFVYLFPAPFVALGLVIALHVVRVRLRGRACADWPTASGKIVDAHRDIAIEIDHDDKTRPFGRRETKLYGAVVKYAYRVGGHDYEGKILDAGPPVRRSDPKYADDILAKYRPGSSVPVYYNPDNPTEALLEPLNFKNANVSLGVALGFAGFGVLSFLWLLHASAT
jgi:hypothetical protein